MACLLTCYWSRQVTWPKLGYILFPVEVGHRVGAYLQNTIQSAPIRFTSLASVLDYRKDLGFSLSAEVDYPNLHVSCKKIFPSSLFSLLTWISIDLIHSSVGLEPKHLDEAI